VQLIRRGVGKVLRAGCNVAAFMAPLVCYSNSMAQTPSPPPSFRQLSPAEQQIEAARRMDNRLARQERTAKQALSGICDGCYAPPSRRGRGFRMRFGADGLLYDPHDQ
jgi:hypothetical protein